MGGFGYLKSSKIAKLASQIANADRDYYLETRYPSFGNLVPRDVASRNTKAVCDEGRGVMGGRAVYLDLTEALAKQGKKALEDKYGNLFQMYEKITAENPYQVPMQIYPAPHYAMGGLWVDYELQSTIAGLFVIGEANFSDHGANRLGASAMMQGLADGYFVLPYTISNYLARHIGDTVNTEHPAFQLAEDQVRQQVHDLLGRGKGAVTPSTIITANWVKFSGIRWVCRAVVRDWRKPWWKLLSSSTALQPI